MHQTIFQACSKGSGLKKYIGRSYEQVDCWDLVREFYLAEFNIELSQIYSGPNKQSPEFTSMMISSNKGQFLKVEDSPRYGDLMAIKLFGVECHIGIFIGEGKFLHSVRTTGSVLDSLEKYKHLITGYYRHKGRAA